ncbi:MAG: hypothetical protein ABFS05_01950 [Bacteroidota bacterium]
MHDLYEPKLYCSIFLDDLQDKIYAEVSPTIKRYDSDKVKIILDYDSTTKKIDILIKIIGYEETPIIIDELPSQTVKIIDPSLVVDIPGVKSEIGANVYEVTARVYKNGQPVKTGGGTITQNSDIEIL